MDPHTIFLCVKPECLHLPNIFNQAIHFRPNMNCPPIYLDDIKEQLRDPKSRTFKMFNTDILEESFKRIDECFNAYISELKQQIITTKNEMSKQYTIILSYRQVFQGIFKDDMQLIQQNIKIIGDVLNPKAIVESAGESIRSLEEQLKKSISVDRLKQDWDQQYLNVKPNEGYGEFKFYDGVYKGNWKQGKQDGLGENTWTDGTVYKGNWKEGNMDGLGEKTFASGVYKGDVYSGNWREGKWMDWQFLRIPLDTNSMRLGEMELKLNPLQKNQGLF